MLQIFSVSHYPNVALYSDIDSAQNFGGKSLILTFLFSSREGREQNRKQEKWKGSSSIWFTPVLFAGAEAEDEPQEVAEGSV